MSKIGDLCLRNFSLICATNISHNSMTDCFSALFVINVIKLMNERDSALRESKANTFRFFEEGLDITHASAHGRRRRAVASREARRGDRGRRGGRPRVRCRRARARRRRARGGEWRHRRDGRGAFAAASPGRRRRPLNDREWRGAIDREGRVAEDKFASVLRRAASDGVAPDIRPEVWPLLLGVRRPESTAVEQEQRRRRRRAAYDALLARRDELDKMLGSRRLSPGRPPWSGVPGDARPRGRPCGTPAEPARLREPPLRPSPPRPRGRPRATSPCTPRASP